MYMQNYTTKKYCLCCVDKPGFSPAKSTDPLKLTIVIFNFELLDLGL